MTGNPRRVLVTGGRGFIGRHIAARFAGEGAGVLVLDTAPEAPPEEPAAEVPFGRWQKSRPSFSLHHLETARLDVATAEAEDAVVSFSPDLIVHAAAQTRPPRSVADPFDDSRTNVLGTLRMLEAARTVGVKGFIFISSAAIYGDSSVLPLTEDAPHRPLSPYGVSKLAATNYVSYYGRAGLLPALSLIPANVYGPGQQAGEDGAVVPAFIRAALRGEPVTIEGDGSQTRDFVYVEDLVEAVRLAWRWLGRGGGQVQDAPTLFNIGTGKETGISHLADLVERTVGRRLGRRYRPARRGDISRSSLSPGLARRLLGWCPRVGLEEGLRRTYEWWVASTPGRAPRA